MTTKTLYQQWIEALPNYNRAFGQLRETHRNSFCCLGVLCDISQIGEWNPITPETYVTEFEYSASILPDDVITQVELFDGEGTFDLKELSQELQEEILEAHIDKESYAYILLQKSMGNKDRPTLMSLANVNDHTSVSPDDKTQFDLVIKILEEAPPSLFHGINAQYYPQHQEY